MSCEKDAEPIQGDCRICGTWLSNEVIPIDGEYAAFMYPLIELHIYGNDSVYISGKMNYSGNGFEDSALTSTLSGKRVPILELHFDKKYIDLGNKPSLNLSP